ncbi:lysophospholipase [Fistulina hepatica ATCC 64428]|uniref:Lysophospholipase n=1 Tax=Fistulina hepatica ATCC 64428 TaxID=1128425 RepID=A0A0D7A1N2_9AGAR|nr:lysophospholipase [Fistulina hepatica ATCC 64428]
MIVLLAAFGVALAAAASSHADDASVLYTPVVQECSDNFTLIRNVASGTSQSLSPQESAYVYARRSQVLPSAWSAYLSNVEATGLDLPDYVSDILSNTSYNSGPNLGIATSGGGYRAAIFGAGVLSALDGRNVSAVTAGTGGLLQAATYLAGLSGGSWLVSSLVQADAPIIPAIAFGVDNTGADDAATITAGYQGWLAQYSFLNPFSSHLKNVKYVDQLFDELNGKAAAGFPVTFTDLWARAVSRHFLNGTAGGDFLSKNMSHGAGITFSSFARQAAFESYEAPFPIILADLLSQNGNSSTILAGNYIPLTNPIFEFNIYEMGSYDPGLSAFTPTEYLGSTNTTTCVTNFDQGSFLFATSSNIYNEYNTTNGLLSSPIGTYIQKLQTYHETSFEIDAAAYPNPFYGVQSFIDSDETYLTMVDGGEDGEVIPFQPLLVKARDIDVIIAIDASGSGANNYANGDSLVVTQTRVSDYYSDTYAFPPVPTSADIIVAENLTTRPTFFGCDSDVDVPLVIYIANGGPPRDGSTPATNTTTGDNVYSTDELVTMLDQSFTVATQGYPADADELVDLDWAACLACAIVDRARARGEVEESRRSGLIRRTTQRSGICSTCFDRYCWSD